MPGVSSSAARLDPLIEGSYTSGSVTSGSHSTTSSTRHTAVAADHRRHSSATSDGAGAPTVAAAHLPGSLEPRLSSASGGSAEQPRQPVPVAEGDSGKTAHEQADNQPGRAGDSDTSDRQRTEEAAGASSDKQLARQVFQALSHRTIQAESSPTASPSLAPAESQQHQQQQQSGDNVPVDASLAAWAQLSSRVLCMRDDGAVVALDNEDATASPANQTRTPLTFGASGNDTSSADAARAAPGLVMAPSARPISGVRNNSNNNSATTEASPRNRGGTTHALADPVTHAAVPSPQAMAAAAAYAARTGSNHPRTTTTTATATPQGAPRAWRRCGGTLQDATLGARRLWGHFPVLMPASMLLVIVAATTIGITLSSSPTVWLTLVLLGSAGVITIATLAEQLSGTMPERVSALAARRPRNSIVYVTPSRRLEASTQSVGTGFVSVGASAISVNDSSGAAVPLDGRVAGTPGDSNRTSGFDGSRDSSIGDSRSWNSHGVGRSAFSIQASQSSTGSHAWQGSNTSVATAPSSTTSTYNTPHGASVFNSARSMGELSDYDGGSMRSQRLRNLEPLQTSLHSMAPSQAEEVSTPSSTGSASRARSMWQASLHWIRSRTVGMGSARTTPAPGTPSPAMPTEAAAAPPQPRQASDLTVNTALPAVHVSDSFVPPASTGSASHAARAPAAGSVAVTVRPDEAQASAQPSTQAAAATPTPHLAGPTSVAAEEGEDDADDDGYGDAEADIGVLPRVIQRGVTQRYLLQLVEAKEAVVEAHLRTIEASCRNLDAVLPAAAETHDSDGDARGPTNSAGRAPASGMRHHTSVGTRRTSTSTQLSARWDSRGSTNDARSSTHTARSVDRDGASVVALVDVTSAAPSPRPHARDTVGVSIVGSATSGSAAGEATPRGHAGDNTNTGLHAGASGSGSSGLHTAEPAASSSRVQQRRHSAPASRRYSPFAANGSAAIKPLPQLLLQQPPLVLRHSNGDDDDLASDGVLSLPPSAPASARQQPAAQGGPPTARRRRHSWMHELGDRAPLSAVDIAALTGAQPGGTAGGSDVFKLPADPAALAAARKQELERLERLRATRAKLRGAVVMLRNLAFRKRVHQLFPNLDYKGSWRKRIVWHVALVAFTVLSTLSHLLVLRLEATSA